MVSLILMAIAVCCQTRLDTENLIDQKSPFFLTKMSSAILLDRHQVVIEINSEKWIKLVEFIKLNSNKWESTPASYEGDLIVVQDDFKLLILNGKDSVVLNYKDKEGRSKQYIKKVSYGELDFLYA